MRVPHAVRTGRRKVLAALSALVLGVTGVVGATAALSPDAAAATVNPPDDSVPSTWNHIGTPDGTLNQPTVTVSDGIDTAQPGQSVTYSYTFHPQLQGNQTSDSDVAQQWTAMEVCSDPKAPFSRAPQRSDFTVTGGNLADFQVSSAYTNASGATCYTVRIGAQMTISDAENGVLSSNNANYAGYDSSYADYQAPRTITASLPATVAANATGTVTGTARVQSGRMILPTWTQPDRALVTFSNFDDNAGTCTVTATGNHTLQGSYGMWMAYLRFTTSQPSTRIDPSTTKATYTITDANGDTIDTSGSGVSTYSIAPADADWGGEVDAGYHALSSFDWPSDQASMMWVPGGSTAAWTLTATMSNCYSWNQPTTYIAAALRSFRDPEEYTATAQDTFTVTTPTAAFAVKKTTSDSALTLSGTDAQDVTRNYDVTVTNTGDASGTSEAVIDTPNVPEGYTVKSVTVDGQAATDNGDGTYTLSNGVTLAAGASSTLKVVVTYTVDPAKISADGWAALDTACTVDGAADATPHGMANVVSMTGDTDGAANNEACTTATGTPGISIKKYINGDDADTAPGVEVAVGSTMNITYVVTNTGNQPLTGVKVTDQVTAPADSAQVTDLACPKDTLAVGETITCTATLAAPAAGVQHTDTGTVVGTPPATPSNPNPTPVTDNNPANAKTTDAPVYAVSKTTTDTAAALTSSDVQDLVRTYTVTVTNTNNVAGTTSAIAYDVPSVPTGFTIKSVTVDGTAVTADAQGRYPISAGDDIAAGGSKDHSVVVTYSVDPTRITTNEWTSLSTCQTGASPDSTKGVFNEVTMEGDSDGAANNNACTTVTGKPGIKIVKYINGDDADTAPGVATTAGSTMNITYVVTNTGNQPLTDVTVTDDKVAAADIKAAADFTGTLAPGASTTFTATYPAPAAGEQHTNVGTVTGVPPQVGDNPPTVTDDNPANAHTPSAPAFSVSKTTSEDPAVITGTGTSTLTRTYTVTVTNTGSADGTSPEITDIPSAPEGFTISSVTSNGMAATAGLGGSYTLSSGVELAKGASTTMTVVVTYTVDPTVITAADWAALDTACTVDGTQDATLHGLANVVSMTGDNDGAANNEACTTVTGTPGIKIVKYINDDDADTAPGVEVAVGSTMNITYVVTNTGNEPLSGVTVTDDKVAAADIKAATGFDGNLAVGASTTFTATYAAPAAGTQHTNVGTAHGTPPSTPSNPNPPEVTDHNPANAHSVAGPSFKVSKALASDQTTPVTVGDDNTFTVKYVITVTNTGDKAGVFQDLTDKLSDSLPAGFSGTVTPATITGESLEPGESKSYTVTLSGKVDPTESAADDNAGWTAAATCDTTSGADGTGDKTKGIYNQVVMGSDNSSDTDGIGNNDACVPIQSPNPQFQVHKDLNAAQTTPVEVGSDNTFAVRYDVTVENIGKTAGAVPAVTDTPTLPTGFTVTRVQLGTATDLTADANGVYTLLDDGALTLGAGKSQTLQVTVYGTVDPQTADWTAAGTCDTTGAGTATKGLFNKVDMTGDTDGPDNNDACAPVQAPAPTFKVQKTTADGPVALTGTKATDVDRTYTVTVTNSGSVDGTSAAVIDTPATPAGFTITKVTVDGTTVAADNGGYEVTAGDQLARGASKDHTVVVSYSVDPAVIGADAANWTTLGTCAVDGDSTDATKGIYNKVTMEGDSDGADNNDACTTVTGSPSIKITKFINGDDADTTPGVAVPVGSTMNLEYRVENTGNQPLTDVKVTDQVTAPADATQVSDLTCPKTTLAVGEVMTCTAALTAPAAGVQHTDVGTVTAVPPQTPGNPPTVTDHNPGNAVSTPDPAFSVKKETSASPITLTGTGKQSFTVDYKVTVSSANGKAGTSKPVTDVPEKPTGFTIKSVTVDGKVITADADGAYLVTAGDALEADGSKEHTVTVSYEADPTVLTAADWGDRGVCSTQGAGDRTKGLFNQVSMAGDTDGVENNDACVPVKGTPGIKIVKKINGDDADTAPGVEVKAGSTMNVTFEVTNTGNEPLTDVTVTDDKIAATDIKAASGFDGNLAVGATTTFTATYPAPAAGAEHVDVGTVTGNPPATPPTPDNPNPEPPAPVTDHNPAHAHTPGNPTPSPSPSSSPSPSATATPTQPVANPTTPSHPTVPVAPVTPHKPSSPIHALAHTGANVLGGIVLLGGLIAAGWILLARRRTDEN